MDKRDSHGLFSRMIVQLGLITRLAHHWSQYILTKLLGVCIKTADQAYTYTCKITDHDAYYVTACNHIMHSCGYCESLVLVYGLELHNGYLDTARL